MRSQSSKDSYSTIIENQKLFFRSKQTRSQDFRIAQLKKLKEVILSNEEKILNALFEDLRKPRFEAYITEIGVLCEEIDYIIKNLKKWVKQKSVPTPLSLKPAKGKIYQDPYGVVAVFAPWNYPFQLLLSPAVGAIAAGNCVILKPADLTTNTQKVILDLINSNFDPGFIHAIGGGIPECEELLKEKFDYIFFTGSPRVGKIIMKAAADHLTPVCLELGGKSPCIVGKDAKIPLAAKRIVWAKFMNAGQTCVAPDYVYVHQQVEKELLKEIKNRIFEVFGENPKKSPYFSGIVSETHLRRLATFLENSLPYVGGDYDVEEKYFSPTVLNTVSWESEIMKEEIFGPILPVLTYNDVDEAISEVNSRPKPLALYHFSESSKEQEKIISETFSGGVCINDCILHLGNPNLPFGGVGNSGMGSYHGEHSFKLLSHAKSVLFNPTIVDNPLRYRPYSEKKLSLVKKLM